jgi:gluconate 2-dehydrogenase gamma chain
MSEPPSRREFLSTSAGFVGAGWLWMNLPAIAALAACARDSARVDAPFRALSPAEGAAMRALASRILPSGDGLPGADEAGAVWFVDGALEGPFASMKEPLLAGLADLDRRAEAAYGDVFAALPPPEQDALVGEIADGPFFGMARLLTVAGVFSDPGYGGNRNDAGATILGVRHSPSYQPPFGWYDAALVEGGGG